MDRIKKTISLIASYSICPGNPDSEFCDLFTTVEEKGERIGYLDLFFNRTVRTTNCLFLTKNKRCPNCFVYCRTLNKTALRRRNAHEIPDRNWTESRKSNSSMTSSEKSAKLSQLRKLNLSLRGEMNRLRKKLDKLVRRDGVNLYQKDNKELETSTMDKEASVQRAVPDNSSIQRHIRIHHVSCATDTYPPILKFDHSIQKYRVVGLQALVPLTGNGKRKLQLEEDHSYADEKKVLVGDRTASK